MEVVKILEDNNVLNKIFQIECYHHGIDKVKCNIDEFPEIKKIRNILRRLNFYPNNLNIVCKDFYSKINIGEEMVPYFNSFFSIYKIDVVQLINLHFISQMNNSLKSIVDEQWYDLYNIDYESKDYVRALNIRNKCQEYQRKLGFYKSNQNYLKYKEKVILI